VLRRQQLAGRPRLSRARAFPRRRERARPPRARRAAPAAGDADAHGRRSDALAALAAALATRAPAPVSAPKTAHARICATKTPRADRGVLRTPAEVGRLQQQDSTTPRPRRPPDAASAGEPERERVLAERHHQAADEHRGGDQDAEAAQDQRRAAERHDEVDGAMRSGALTRIRARTAARRRIVSAPPRADASASIRPAPPRAVRRIPVDDRDAKPLQTIGAGAPLERPQPARDVGAGRRANRAPHERDRRRAQDTRSNPRAAKVDQRLVEPRSRSGLIAMTSACGGRMRRGTSATSCVT